MPTIRRIIYASTAANVTFKTALDILNIANQNNNTYGITGMLLFNGTYFLQCIEGEETEINQLFSNIQKDRRHHSITVIGNEMSDERYFPNWIMGYLNHSKTIAEIVYNTTQNESFIPSTLSMEQAKTILIESSFLL